MKFPQVLFFSLLAIILGYCCPCDDSTEPDPVSSSEYVDPIDVEGYQYATVQIGNQIWMAENLKTTKYQNGDEIETTLFLHQDLSDVPTPKYQWPYSGNENFVEDYGRLYTWYAIMDERGVCPEGWQLPNNDDWMILANNLGGVDFAGGALKEEGTTHWHWPNEGATNATGFTAIPAGFRKTNGDFAAIGYRTRWWSTTDTPPNNAWRFGVDYDRKGISFNNKYEKWGAYSVRCLRYE